MSVGNALVRLRENEPEETHPTFQKVVESFRKWLYMPDEVPLKVILAVVMTAKIPGDPLWMFVVGPSGDLKTELLRTLGTKTDHVVMVTNATPQALLSGLSQKEGREGLDLLPEIDGKTLVIRDFTTFLSKRLEVVQEFFGRLRTYYDGEYSDHWGSIGEKTGKSHFNLLAAVTPAIDQHSATNQKLGERFLKIRMSTDEERAVESAMRNAGKEDEMRESLRKAVEALLKQAPSKAIEISEEAKGIIANMARLLAFLRTPVSRDHSNILLVSPAPERPTRLVKQFLKLAQGVAVLNGNVEVGNEELSVIRRVLWDSTPPLRRQVMEAFTDRNARVAHRDLKAMTDLPGSTLSRQLEDLSLIGLLRKGERSYRLTPKAEELMSSSMSSVEDGLRTLVEITP